MVKFDGDKTYDLAVIGAGPAGSLAAALAAKAGFSTVILEKKSLPRIKICGGFVSARCLSLLPEDLILPPEIVKPVHTITVVRGNRSYSCTSEKRLGLLVRRDRFDHLMANHACKMGAVLLQKSALKELGKANDGETGPFSYLLKANNPVASSLRARYVIGADGARSSCKILSGLGANNNYRTGWGLTKFVETEYGSEKPGTLTFYPLPFLGGMGWSFNGPGWINRGVGGLANRRLLLKAYRRLFPEDIEKQNPLTWPLPFLGPLQKTACGNLLFIGDAAGLIEPFSGEGLYNSLKSSMMAVQALAKAEEMHSSAGPIYQDFFTTHFQKGFLPSLAGATLLHARSITSPSALPSLIALLMENRLWFNRCLADPSL